MIATVTQPGLYPNVEAVCDVTASVTAGAMPEGSRIANAPWRQR
jgi:hypothetical protein